MKREEEITQKAKEIALNWDEGRGNVFYHRVDMLCNMAKWIDEHPKNPWQDASKELPKNHQDEGCDYSEKILLRVQIGMFMHYIEGGYDFKNKRWCIELHGEATEISHVTHWMLIPELPKGDEK